MEWIAYEQILDRANRSCCTRCLGMVSCNLERRRMNYTAEPSRPSVMVNGLLIQTDLTISRNFLSIISTM